MHVFGLGCTEFEGARKVGFHHEIIAISSSPLLTNYKVKKSSQPIPYILSIQLLAELHFSFIFNPIFKQLGQNETSNLRYGRDTHLPCEWDNDLDLDLDPDLDLDLDLDLD